MNKINQAFDAHLEQVANGRKVDTPREHFEAGYFAGQKNAALAVAELIYDVNPVAANLIREDIAKAKP